MEHEAARDELDGWLIGRLRQQPRRARGEEVVERLLRPHGHPDVLERLEALEEVLLELATRLEALESEHRSSAAEPAGGERTLGHTLFVPTPQGYELVEADGEQPQPGASVTIDARRYTVKGARWTPLPLDRRPCLVLERVPAETETDPRDA